MLDIPINQPKVSIIMPAHNSALTISHSIDSVLRQTYANWELIIVDDCSKDSTYEIMKEYRKKDKRIFIYRSSVNLQAAGARNKGIQNASGRFISFLDSDDIWNENKLEFQINFMISNNLAFSYSDYFVKKISGEIIAFKAKEKATYNDILKSCYIGCLTAIYDASKLGKIYMPERAIKREDQATWLSILKKCDGYNCNEVLATYNLSQNSVSSKKIKMIKYQWNLYFHVEKLNIFKSTYYLLCVILHKIFKYK